MTDIPPIREHSIYCPHGVGGTEQCDACDYEEKDDLYFTAACLLLPLAMGVIWVLIQWQ